MELPTIIGVIASIFCAFSFLPQLIKIFKTKEVNDLSILMLIMLLLGLSCWIYYGVLHNDYIIIVSNAVSILINLLIVFLTYWYKKEPTTNNVQKN